MFSGVITATQSKHLMVGASLGNRFLNRKLQDVQTLPEQEAQTLLGLSGANAATEADDDSDE
jgi:heme oxygenase